MLRRLMDGISHLPLYARDGEGDGTEPAETGTEQVTSEATEGAESGSEAKGAETGADGETDAGEPERAAEPPPKPTQDWRDRELAKRNRQLKAAREEAARAEALRAENQRLQELLEAATKQRGGETEPETRQPAAKAPPADIEAEIDKRAAAKAAQAEFDRACNDAFQKGQREYGKDWDAAIETIQKLGGFEGDDLAEIVGTDDPARVVYELGSNPDLFQRIGEMDARRRRNEFVKIAISPKREKKTVSDAPAPLTPIVARGSGGPSVNLYDPKIQDSKFDDAWYAERMKQKRNSVGRPWSMK